LNGNPTAVYEYGPFAESIRITGAMGKLNPFRFSTKYADDESEFLYYGYRYYSQTTGRWLSHDPLYEIGGKNLYQFVLNRPIYGVDTDGRLVLVDDARIGVIIIAGRIASWLSTPQGQAWLQQAGATIQEATSALADALANAARRCMPCRRQNPTWMRCPATMTSDPGTATMRAAMGYLAFGGPHLEIRRAANLHCRPA
jgi:RHS repeat-associated protein